jgi:hypothetical protein
MKNTPCEKCYFAQKISSNNPCVFNIPNLIKDYHKIEIAEDYYRLTNYSCKYGFSKKTYEENIDRFHDIDMIEYVKTNNIVKYSLALILKENDTCESVYNSIHKLSILPYYITIICKHNTESLHKMLQSSDKYIKYKIHKFLENIPEPQALHIALETNKNNIGNLLWILDTNGLDYCVEQDSVQNINYIINVIQRHAHYYKSKYLNSQFNGIFINSNNYWNLSRTNDYTIENNEHTLVVSYD